MEKKIPTLAEELNDKNEKLYEDISYAIVHDSMVRECFFRIVNLNKELISTIETLENKIAKLEENLVNQKQKNFTVLSLGTDEGNWVFMDAFCEGITYKVEAKVFKEPNDKYGLPESDYRISKFYVKDKTNNKTLVMSDRGYLVGEDNLKNSLVQDFIKTILEYADEEFEKWLAEDTEE